MSFKLNINDLNLFLDWGQEVKLITPKIKNIHFQLHHNLLLQNKDLGWLRLPSNYDKNVINRIKTLKRKYKDLDALVIIGIGGSYIGSRAGIEFTQTFFRKPTPEIIFAGQQVSGNYLSNLIKYLKDKKWALNVISKSGNTLEPALSFRVLKKEIETKYGVQKACEYIFVTTGSQPKNILLDIALRENYETFIIPASIGGRFSVLTVVGMLPFIFANLNVDNILKGAYQAYIDTSVENLCFNSAYKYAVARYLLYKKMSKQIELLVCYDPELMAFSEWWKQLFAESEGKSDIGLFVSSVNNSTDLHSLGQFIQGGSKIIFETVLNVTSLKNDCIIPEMTYDLDKLNYLAGKSFSQINQKILQATKQSHISGNVPNIEIIIDRLNEYHFGYLCYFFQKACAVSALLLDINPFDQPDVEIYKHKMLALLKNI
ncbi:glucose-6-phosphate isomerase [Candidatus Phytoplasma melaleucae]|uniref:Glucose-6-phosphate isomerase n=1 Tax=Candidatus Phytoplasma melaleucae TaxID=2982630 RepID=A0ABT9DCQ3_9MOLU|nr:glucose-6-phosphate isomerase ['Melaleuca sp.' phytoplasma]MDO8167898.1 glucose-6-phosphate isomerase ['Melaleuca sp.' phytoplasma]MDV3205195.1 glucose-6-phosphate isomerase [Weeping tea tree witches'-broom phytoplasma]